MKKINIKYYEMKVRNFKKFFNQNPWSGMVIKTRKSRFFVVDEIKNNKDNEDIILARELEWYEMTGLLRNPSSVVSAVKRKIA